MRVDPISLARACCAAAGLHFEHFVPLTRVGAVLAATSAAEKFAVSVHAGRVLEAAGHFRSEPTALPGRRVVSMTELGRFLLRFGARPVARTAA